MRLTPYLLVFVLVCAAAVSVCQAQAARSPSARDYFSGVVTSLSSNKITVRRTELGYTSSTRTFAVTPETRIEGEPRVKARVTVRFVAEEPGDRAVHIIVRPPAKKK